jgi:eukaryotic-like serine/threonine-protein kinase
MRPPGPSTLTAAEPSRLGSQPETPRLAAVAATSFPPGQVLSGRYRVVRPIARGGMGAVYEAVDEDLGSRVALKVILPEIASDARILERFRREIRLARQVTHPNVCRVFDLGRDGGVPFLTMELVCGETLAQRLKRRGRLDPKEVLPLAEQLASALDAAHRAGVVHRDFKPGNVLLVAGEAGRAERAVVTDFGMSRALVGDGEGVTTTGSGLGPGTPAYMAPEQVKGERVGPGVDTYAFGLVLYEMLTGRLPFAGKTPLAVALRRLTKSPESPRTWVPDLEASWERVILRCLARDPKARFGSAGEAMRALRGQDGGRASDQHGVVPGSGRGRRAVAVLGFRSLTGRGRVAWLSTALAEMLAAELAAGAGLRLIPGENVWRAKLDLGLPQVDTLAPDTLRRLRDHLGADLVVLGSYFAAGGDAGVLRWHVSLQDTRRGRTLLTQTETASEKTLLEVVGRTGERLREHLGSQRLSPTVRLGVRAVQPGTPEVARFYAEGLNKLRRFETLEARAVLEKAVKADPWYPLTRSALAEAWGLLGYHRRASEQAERAYAQSLGLPREERLLIEGRHWEAAKKWTRAIGVYRRLWKLYPDNLDYALHLAETQASSGSLTDTLATIGALRELPQPPASDARIDWIEATVRDWLGDHRDSERLARQAARKGRSAGAHLLSARALLRQASALEGMGHYRRALRALEAAHRTFALAGDPVGAAQALFFTAVAHMRLGQLDKAAGLMGRSLHLRRAAGDLRGVGRAAHALSDIYLQMEGPSSRRRLRLLEEALRAARKVEDRLAEVIIIGARAMVLSSSGQIARARRVYHTLILRSRKLGYVPGEATIANNLASDYLRTGDLANARRQYGRALRVLNRTQETHFQVLVLQGQGDVLLAEGSLARARRAYAKATDLAQRTGQKILSGDTRVRLAGLALEEGRLSEADALARRGLSELEETRRRDGIVLGYATLSRIRLARGRPREAARAARKALATADRRTEIDTQLLAAAAKGRVDSALGRHAPALRALRAVLGRARRLGIVSVALGSRLALGEAELAAGRVEASRRTLRALMRDAVRRGYRLIARNAAKALRRVDEGVRLSRR